MGGQLGLIKLVYRNPLRMVHTNRLANEKSPYLLQHAHNPVDWYPWGEEAFQKARELNRPIFLSVGYSTCHWCHVMERESFENEDIAKVMNEDFVNIKVDREERPNVDRQYMAFVQATTGGGGWPMSVFLTPELKRTLSQLIAEKYREWIEMLNLCYRWKSDSEAIKKSSNNILNQLRETLLAPSKQANVTEDNLQEVTLTFISKTLEYFRSNFDKVYGGFGGKSEILAKSKDLLGAPKFPTPVNLSFLQKIIAMGEESLKIEELNDNNSSTDLNKVKLCYKALGCKYDDKSHLSKDSSKSKDSFRIVLEDVKTMVVKTLECIWRGGIHDHVGHGIHRYAVDRIWHVPHFEKMLYDQGQLLSVYSEAHRMNPDNPIFGNAIQDIISYMRTSLRHAEGGFYCAEDADSKPTESSDKSIEGAFAVWTMEEVTEELPEREFAIFASHFGMKEEGNVPSNFDHHGELRTKNILMEQRSVAETASSFEIDEDECSRILNQCKTALLDIRSARPKPHLDDKIVVSWNALAISGLCKAYNATEDNDAIQLAKDSAEFIKKHLVLEDGHLLRFYRNGPSDVEAAGSDYAFMIAALLDLWECTLIREYLDWAIKLQKLFKEIFWDSEMGGFYSSSKDATDIHLRLKDDQDGAEPSINSVAALNLVRLAGITEEDHYQKDYLKLTSSFFGYLYDTPHARPALVSSFLYDFILPRNFKLALPSDSGLHEPVHKLLKVINREAGPFKFISTMNGDKEAVQICRGTVCMSIVSDVNDLRAIINSC